MTTVARPLRRMTLFMLLAGALTLTLVAAPAQAKKVTTTFFGMHDSQIANGSIPKVALGTIRLWDTGTTWREIETQPPTPPLLPGQPVEYHYDFSKLDAAVGNAQTAGLRPLIVLGQTPQFYASDPTAPSGYGPGASSMPNDLAAWQNYVATVASRYGTDVDYQIWNEPNVIQYWSGTPAQMATLTATGAATINQAIGTGATVVAPGFPLRLKSQRTWFGKYWNQKVGGLGMASYVDVVAMHLYPPADKGPETSMELLKQGRSLLSDAARKKPEWNTEINYGLLGGATAKQISSAKQAAYVARTLLLNAGSPISRMYWYGWAQGGVANTHLVADDRTTLTPAGKAWQRVYGWTLGTSFSSCSMFTSGKSKGVWTCKAKKSRRETRRFYWKPSGSSAPITTVSSTSSWTSLKGRVTKHKGSYAIKVGPTPIMVTSRR
jgi:hypothetical protein